MDIISEKIWLLLELNNLWFLYKKKKTFDSLTQQLFLLGFGSFL